MKPLLEELKTRRLYFDGGMGSMLQGAGLPEGLLPDVWSVENPTAVQGVHRAYLQAGSRLITTNTFGATAPKLAPYGLTPAQVVTAAVEWGYHPVEDFAEAQPDLMVAQPADLLALATAKAG